MLESVHLSVERVPQGLVARVMTENLTEREAQIVVDELCKGAQEAFGDGGWGGVALDLTNVRFMASAGIGAVLTIHKRCGEKKAKLAVYGINDDIMAMMKMTKLHKLLPLVKDEPAALKKIG